MTEAQWLASTNPREMYAHLLLAGREPSAREKEAYVEACREHAGQANPHRCWRWGTFDSWLEGVAWASTVSPATRAHYLRDVVGNPFREASLTGCKCGFCVPGGHRHDGPCPLRRLLTPSIVAMGHAAYYGRDVVTDLLDPVRLSVLEEGGCCNCEVLTHLRSPGPHVKGCWALRLVYGRS